MSKIVIGRGHGACVSYLKYSSIIHYTVDDWTDDYDLAWNFKTVFSAVECVQKIWFRNVKLENIGSELKKQRIKSKIFKPVQGRFIQIDGVDVFPSRKSIRNAQEVMNIMES